ncbi:MAG: lysophospholipid acyltransferase family protein [Verrucomicrobiales bacterium]|nr:lysophospholipid acyltransferase family protein [Verrucomicrobiales bacterium]
MKAKLFGWIIAAFIRLIGLTLRWQFEDKSGLSSKLDTGSVIWVFWHNRVFSIPLVYRRYLSFRSGAVLTSSSKDGEIMVQVMKRFGVETVRGSSNRSPVNALRRLVKYLKNNNGSDVAITPDGPRGPLHVLQPGVIKLAQITGFPILPITILYSRSMVLKTWDKFEIPFPFSKVKVLFNPFHHIENTSDKQEFETMRVRLEEDLKALP